MYSIIYHKHQLNFSSTCYATSVAVLDFEARILTPMVSLIQQKKDEIIRLSD